MSKIFTCRVYGVPKPQGSHRAFVIPGKGGAKARAIVTAANPQQGAWRDTMTSAFAETLNDEYDGPGSTPRFVKTAVNVAATFIMPKPKTAKKDAQPISAPDADKLFRTLGDSLQESCVLSNDSAIVSWDGSIKRYAVFGEAVGVYVTVTEKPYVTPTRIP